MTHPRFATFFADGRSRYGLVGSQGIVDLSERYGSSWPTLREVVADAAFDRLLDKASGFAPDFFFDQITYEIPVPAPEKIICVGVNFPDRNEEYKDGQAAPSNPSLFIRFPRSFTGHEQPLIRPPESPQLDYEGEIVIVIGKGGRRIAEADALSHIAALSLCNEGTIRDWVRHAKFNVTQGKNFDRTGAIGPWLVPYRDESQLSDIRLETRVNGEVRQSDRTSRMIFSFRKIINYISTFTTFVPGDVIVTGTPTGAGARFDPPIWLKPGDVVEVEADGLGVLRNTIADEV
ncbi:fumarylacetoacetate hydrolase protein (plasmid) [Rhizobium phaseoli]|uniref:fumarylacetoacetate hydrolase family protein n=1 Tax=Rhizobium phaseoli TaxID=396 RepID=UPI0007E976AE|nr:fumarylacetoacetate hydrolase family protein [Rhizobium phaseoli]ANL69815.1 fumarylacetoacetate hydrolase protein [Rhizobium phaseoli]ANL76252.1 fumarylacetoacetate hydrolase protein [Rhizobium phaseoli]ANL82609.1 fumarylacetoacetate hydrolase protein [Rhizobium phaseoli]PDS68718.1 FAA hydrolase family protein [Rhizobium phaseoli]